MTFCIFDAHADTVSKLMENGGSLLSNKGHLDLMRIKNLKCPYVQVFAAFTESKSDAFSEVLAIINKYYEFVSSNDDLIHCTSYEDIEKGISHKKISSLLSIEGGDALCGSIERLKEFYRLGVRIMNLTWNYKNEIAAGIMEENDFGLTAFGKDVVLEMNKLGMIVDVSHLSEKGFWDVAEISEKPFIASHSNAKKICSHKRNLSDEQIKEIINKKGVIGINFYSDFLSDEKECSISDIIRHAEHILSLGGENSLGFGSDFDGMEKLPREILGVENYYDIINEFLKLGYSEDLVKKISSDNFLRIVKEIL